MKKYLLSIEFRYSGVGRGILRDEEKYICKTITMGVFDTIDEAVKEGNVHLKELAKTFDVRDSFKVKGYFGIPDTLVTNTCTKDKVHFYAQIKTLDFKPLDEMVTEALKARKDFENLR